MNKNTIDDISVRGKRVLVRLDLNVPLENGRITDDRRIEAALPTLRKLIGDGGRLICMSHLGRPDEEPENREAYTLAPVAGRLEALLHRTVPLLPDCVGQSITEHVAKMRDGDVCLLENLRFHPEETIRDSNAAKNAELRDKKNRFARQVAQLGDAFVNDAFGTCHRDNASMLTVPVLMQGKPRVVGYLVQRELKYLGDILAAPEWPFVCILGGAKVSDKLGVIQALLEKCETILIGGAMAYTFLAADGIGVGKSLVEPDLFEEARRIRERAGRRLLLPTDSVCSPGLEHLDQPTTINGSIPLNLMGLDIGPETVQRFVSRINKATTILWNGPMGVFETPPFDEGTLKIAHAVAFASRPRGQATSIVGGGDTAAAIDHSGLADWFTHISTGGGASLEFLEGKPFKPLEVLDDA